MTETRDYSAIAQAYVDGARGLFTTDGTPTVGPVMRSMGKVNPSVLAERAAALLPVSATLTEVTATKTHSRVLTQRGEGQVQLLAKANADLEIAEQLLQAAQVEARRSRSPESVKRSVVERGIEVTGIDDDNLHVLLDVTSAGSRLRERSATVVTSRESAVEQLQERTKVSIRFIPERTAKMAQDTLGGIIALGLTDLARSAVVAGTEIANLIGQGEQFSKLVGLVRDYAVQAFNAIKSLFGEGMVAKALDKAKEYLDKLVGGELMKDLVERLYGVDTIREHVSATIQSSQADLAYFAKAINGVDELNELHRITTDRVGKLTKGLTFLAALPLVKLPNINLLFAVSFLLLGGFAFGVGADYLDVDPLKLEGGVDGVPKIVDKQLG